MIFIGIWVVGALLTFRRVFRATAEDLTVTFWSEFVECFLATLLIVALFWPGVWIYKCLQLTIGRYDPEMVARKLAGESASAKTERKEHELRVAEQRIHELERELAL